MIAIDKIPLDDFKEDILDNTFHLGTVVLTKSEYGLAEKLNQIIDYLNELESLK